MTSITETVRIPSGSWDSDDNLQPGRVNVTYTRPDGTSYEDIYRWEVVEVTDDGTLVLKAQIL